jgi:uroporphyrinogen decarboxylase
MTGQERVNRMFRRQDHDRVPRHESFWAETIERWQKEGLTGDARTVLDMLQTDFHQLCWLWPTAFPGEDEIVSQDEQTKVVRDAQGKLVRYWKAKSGTPEHLGFECDSREKWETIFKPALLNSGLQVDPEAAKRNFAIGRKKGRWCFMAGVEGFEETRSLMGDEITMIAMAEDPDWVRDVSKTFADVMIRNLDACMATGIAPDGLWIYGDMAFNHATMCSPKMYRELIWPDHKRLADWAHVHNMKFIFHTDGDVNGVMDLYVEAGFDCLQPLEAKANMDEIRQRPGVFWQHQRHGDGGEQPRSDRAGDRLEVCCGEIDARVHLPLGPLRAPAGELGNVSIHHGLRQPARKLLDRSGLPDEESRWPRRTCLRS